MDVFKRIDYRLFFKIMQDFNIEFLDNVSSSSVVTQGLIILLKSLDCGEKHAKPRIVCKTPAF